MFSVYQGVNVFLTGHTGFKGAWLALWLEMLGANVTGYALAPETEPALFNVLNLGQSCSSLIADIRDSSSLEAGMRSAAPDIVFHLAAQPLVRRSYFEPFLTYETNVLGTLNVLETARKCAFVKAFVNITTDKCYENYEAQHGFKEDDPMGGHDMYSSSKACAEIMSSSYRRSFLQKGSYALATARAGNVIGGGDWAEDRLIPDCIRAINANKPVEIRSPDAVRPWQHVLEPLSGYLMLGEKLLAGERKFADAFNFGPDVASALKVGDVARKVVEFYGKGEIVINKKDDLHEAKLLMLNINKARTVLGWQPRYSADKAIAKTVEWYKAYYSGHSSMLDFTRKQIEEYDAQ